jgi:hypothetical protein
MLTGEGRRRRATAAGVRIGIRRCGARARERRPSVPHRSRRRSSASRDPADPPPDESPARRRRAWRRADLQRHGPRRRGATR